ncbi:MAG: hypothetical protein AB7G13_17425 [Lautropia sp.]
MTSGSLLPSPPSLAQPGVAQPGGAQSVGAQSGGQRPAAASRTREAAAPAFDRRRSRQVADTLGQLALLLRLYAQSATGLDPADSATEGERLRGETDRAIAQLRQQAARTLGPAGSRQLGDRWGSIRDALQTRPSPEIARLMDQIADGLALQLRGLAGPPPAAGSGADPALERAWQRSGLQQLARAGVFGCWHASLARPDLIAARQRDFDDWLRRQQSSLGAVIWVQYNAQWNLLKSALPRPGAGCMQAASRTIVDATDRLTVLLGR